MSHFNPLVQGWAGSAHSPPSVFGALPTQGVGRTDTRPPLPDAFTFLITHFRPNILNATVVGPPSGGTVFRIVTDPARPLYTTYQDMQGRTFAMVDWGSSGRPVVEMPGLLARQSIRSWLRSSSDHVSRHMEIRGGAYRWVPVDTCICLYATFHSQSHVIARISSHGDGVHLEMTSLAMQYGLLEVCVLNASIFLSGYNID